ncbi:transcription antitermination factor NusB [candidate division KSB1 bacterium]|nr:MAG: transcription antitermination factor NusB [candidate division KSB1 bacterium]
MRSRRAAREWALRILYAHEMSGNPVEQIYQDLLGRLPDNPNMHFCREVCRRVAEKDAYIDQLIESAVQKWDISRIAVLDHIILRAAIAEFLYFDDIPFKVTINEAIELAKRYSTSQSGRFVNGILDALSIELQKKISKPADLSTEVPTP